jgi:tetratricopeptide (TPR) repeat protein
LRLSQYSIDEGILGRSRRFALLARDLGLEPEFETRANLLFGEVALAFARPDEGLAAYSRALKGVEHSPDEDARARGLFGLAACKFLGGEPEQAVEIARNGADAFPDLPAFPTALGNIALSRGEYSQADENFLRALSFAEKRGDVRELAAVRTNYGRFLLATGKLSQAVECHERSAAEFEEAGVRSEMARAYSRVAMALRRSGCFQKAADYAERALTIQRELGDQSGVAYSEVNLGILSRELGMPGTALRHFRRAASAAAAAGKAVAHRVFHDPLLIQSRALLDVQLGRVRKARVVLRSARREARESDRPAPEEVLAECAICLACEDGASKVRRVS